MCTVLHNCRSATHTTTISLYQSWVNSSTSRKERAPKSVCSCRTYSSPSSSHRWRDNFIVSFQFMIVLDDYPELVRHPLSPRVLKLYRRIGISPYSATRRRGLKPKVSPRYRMSKKSVMVQIARLKAQSSIQITKGMDCWPVCKPVNWDYMHFLYTADNSNYLATLTGMKHKVSKQRPTKSWKGSKNKAKDRTKEGTTNDDQRNIGKFQVMFGCCLIQSKILSYMYKLVKS